MRMTIAAIGRMKAGPERELAARYLDRAKVTGKPLGLSGFDVRETVESRAGDAATRKRDEAQALLAARAERAVLIALDERGTSLGSEPLAHQVAAWRDAGTSQALFVIGGADGLDPDLTAAATLMLSFSKLTWPHQLVRVMLAEQLYRTTTILAGHPYHRGD